MTWRDWLPALLGRKASATTRSVVQMFLGRQPVWTPKNYEQLAKEGYQQNVTVYACVNEIAQAIGSLDWLLTRKGRGGRAVELDAHPLLDLLRRPNPFEGRAFFFGKLAGFLMLSGNGYVEAVTPGREATPRELYALRPDRMRVIPHPLERVGGYRWEANGVPFEFEAGAILHTKLFHPTDDWYGLSPIEVAARAIDTDNESLVSNMRLLQNGLRPSGALVVQGNLGDAEFTRLKTEMQQEYGGSDRTGTPMLLEGGMDWKAMGITPRDMDFLQGRKMTQLDICRAYKVPPELVNLKEGTFENRKEARKALYTEAVLPVAEMLRDDLNGWLVPRYGDRLSLDFDRDAIEALQEDRKALWERVRQADWLTVNEKRVATGYDEVERGDVLLVPTSLVPLDQAGLTGPAFGELPGGEGDTAPPAGEPQDDEIADETDDQSGDEKALDTKADRRAAIWRHEVLAVAPIERAYHLALARYLRAQGREVVARMRALQRLGAGVALETKDVTEILFEVDEATGKLREVSRPYFEQAVQAGGHAVELELGVTGQFNGTQPDVQQRLAAQVAALKQVPERIRAYIQAVIEQALNDPAGVPPIREIADRIQQVYRQLAEGRARTIARTETAKAFADGRWSAFAQMGIREIEWLSARDEAVRTAPWNHAIDGERRALGQPFSNGLRYPHAPEGAPGNVINCFLPGTAVGGRFVAGLKARYAGPVRCIKTARGHRLAVTPNHPILTAQGWLPAGELEKGMHVFSGSSHVEPVGLRAVQDQQIPSTIEDVFQALAIQRGLRSSGVALSDLHGDAIWTDGQIDVVGANGDTLRNAPPALTQDPGELIVVAPAPEQFRVERLRPGELAIQRVDLPAPRRPGGRALTADRERGALQLQPLQPFRIGAGAHLDALLDEVAVQCAAGDPRFIGQTLQRFAGLIATDEIVEVAEDEFVGHVFDLQEVSGVMVAGGLLTSNCRCVVLPVTR